MGLVGWNNNNNKRHTHKKIKEPYGQYCIGNVRWLVSTKSRNLQRSGLFIYCFFFSFQSWLDVGLLRFATKGTNAHENDLRVIYLYFFLCVSRISLSLSLSSIIHKYATKTFPTECIVHILTRTRAACVSKSVLANWLRERRMKSNNKKHFIAICYETREEKLFNVNSNWHTNLRILFCFAHNILCSCCCIALAVR